MEAARPRGGGIGVGGGSAAREAYSPQDGLLQGTSQMSYTLAHNEAGGLVIMRENGVSVSPQPRVTNTGVPKLFCISIERRFSRIAGLLNRIF